MLTGTFRPRNELHKKRKPRAGLSFRGLVCALQLKGGVMNCKNLVLAAVLASSMAGCYAYAGPPRHAHYRRERVVVVERPRPAPVVVHERVIVRDQRRY